jgi:mannose-1-phosphate guanylyltransferase
VANRPLIASAFDRLIEAGIEEIAVNTHHLPDAYGLAFPGGSYRGVPLHFRHEPDLLETGGGIRNVADLMGDGPFAVYNGDIYSTLSVAGLVARHFAAGNEVTLALRSAGGPLQVSLEPGSDRVADIGGRAGSGLPGAFLFTGIYIVEPAFLRRIPPGEKLSVIGPLVEAIRDSRSVGAAVIDEGGWWDLGDMGRYLALHRHLAAHPAPPFGPPPWVHPTASVAPDARLLGAVAVGPRATVGSGATVADSVVWADAAVLPGARVSGSVVLSGAAASGEQEGAAILPQP